MYTTFGVMVTEGMKLDATALKKRGISFVISRANWGNVLLSKEFATHCQQAYDNGLVFLPLTYVDCQEYNAYTNYQKQLAKFYYQLKNKLTHGFIVQATHYWAASTMKPTLDLLTPHNINMPVKLVADALIHDYGKPVAIFTSVDMTTKKCPELAAWIDNDQYLRMAEQHVLPRAIGSSVDEMIALARSVKVNPGWLVNKPSEFWDMGAVIVPEIVGLDGKPTVAALVGFNGTVETLHTMFNFKVVVPPTPPVVPPVPTSELDKIYAQVTVAQAALDEIVKLCGR